MKENRWTKMLTWLLVLLLALPAGGFAQGTGPAPPVFHQEELDQMLASVALYPDELLVQVLMAATYPLEVVEAARWVKANPNLKGNQLSYALEQKNWDPSVKSLVNFPSVLAMMNEQLEWTQRLGDAFLSQQDQVMETVQKLRERAYAQGNLQTTSQQKVIVQEKIIIIEPASPQVVYVPVYNPTVVYGAWWYPSYPPYYYYPPGYVAGTAAFSFAAGVAVGLAWGYAWGNFNWGHYDVNVNVNKNININNNINRNKYASKVTTGQGGKGIWEHDVDHRKGVAYRDSKTQQKYRQDGRQGADRRKDFRGYTPDTRDRQAKAGDKQAVQQRKDITPRDTKMSAKIPTADKQKLKAQPYSSAMRQPSNPNAFDGINRGGRDAKMSSDRGRQSRESMNMQKSFIQPGSGVTGGRSGNFGGGAMGGRGGRGGRR